MKKRSVSCKYQMTFPQNIIEEPLMYKLSTAFKVIPNILKGRITSSSAKLHIELTGTQANLKKAIEYLEGKGNKKFGLVVRYEACHT